MNFLGKIAEIATGGIGKEIMGIVSRQFPGKLSPQEEAELDQSMQALEDRRIAAGEAAQADAENRVTQRISALEGTAADLKAVPVVGTIVLFLRGSQRPLWGFATLYLDWQWFSGAWEMNERQETALLAINLLVLGFLFGERAIKNLTPLLVQVFGKSSTPADR